MDVDDIRSIWRATPSGYASPIKEITELGYRCWALRTEVSCGVAVPLPDSSTVVRENFSNVSFYTDDLHIADNELEYCLILMSNAEVDNIPFATLCTEFISPGDDGVFRQELIENPLAWWREWKNLLGNRTVDEIVYDVLGELLVLAHLARQGKDAVWRGPERSTYDIDCGNLYVEVKSSVARNKREVTLNNRFQLCPPEGSQLRLVLCQLEAAQLGHNIESVLSDLVGMGYDASTLNAKLDKLGLGVGKSARRRCYMLHDMVEYVVDDDFPAIRDESFVGGSIPQNVKSFTYTLSLDGLTGKSMLKDGN